MTDDPPGGRPNVVLVAGDSTLVRSMLRQHLEAGGYEVIEADDGPGAIELATERSPDVAIVDSAIPGVRGRTLLTVLREDERLAGIPVILLVGQGDSADALDGLRSGAHDFLVKPFQGDEVLGRVNAATKTKAVRDELRQTLAEVERIRFTDLLTGVSNRRQLQEVVERAAAAARRRRRALGILMIDVDYLRRINDERGHAAGDEVLRTVARRIEHSLRAEDQGGRWGGGEFLVVLPETEEEGVWTLAERIRLAVQDVPVVVPGGDDLVATVSIGCATGDGADSEHQIRRADAALAEAKTSGRNRVVVAV